MPYNVPRMYLLTSAGELWYMASHVLGGGVAHGDHTLGHVGKVQVESLI